MVIRRYERVTIPFLIIVALLSFSPYRHFVPGPSPGEIMAGLAIPWIAFALLRMRSGDVPWLPILGLPLLAFLWLSGITQDIGKPIDGLKLPAQWTLHGLLFCGLYLWAVREPGSRTDRLISVLLKAAVINVIVCIVQMGLGPGASWTYMPWGPEWTPWYTRWGLRTYGLFDNPLLAGTFLAAILPLATARLLQNHHHRQTWLTASIIVLGILMTGSRSCILIAFAVTLLQVGPRLKLSGQLILGILAVLAFIGMLFTPVGERFLTVLTQRGDENLSNRIVATEAGLNILNDYPMLGVGPGLFSEAYKLHYKPIQSQDHETSFTLDNMLFQLTCEAGIPFGILCYLVYLYGLISAWVQRREYPTGVFYCLIVYGLASLAVALFATPIMWLLIIFLALIEVNNTLGRKTHQAALASASGT